MNRRIACCFSFLFLTFGFRATAAQDHLYDLQNEAITANRSDAAHWGTDANKYTGWGNHSNRLIPVYTYGTKGGGAGVDLTGYTGAASVYRDKARLTELYGTLPEQTLAEDAEYMDQTNVYDIQMAAVKAGKKHVFLVVFDGMDWQTTRAAAIYNTNSVGYDTGRGAGTHFQEYQAGGTSQFGFMVTAPHNDGTRVDVNNQTVLNAGGERRGGYDPLRGGWHPWDKQVDAEYLIGRGGKGGVSHPFTDSACSATSMSAGIKSYNNAISVDPLGRPVQTIAHQLQEQGWLVGLVTSVPISHATPGAAYAHNVTRHDYQDISRDLLGRPSISHPGGLPGMDIVLGGGWGVTSNSDKGQGENFEPGNRYLADSDMTAVDVRNGGKYVVAQRTLNVDGGEGLRAAAQLAAADGKRLLGYFGTPKGNLPYQTANGDYKPALTRSGNRYRYSLEDVLENPTLAEMTNAALVVAGKSGKPFWLMVEAGDVDWANHDNDLDSSIGAVNSGDAAFRVITEWVEQHSNWDESLVIVTADHGHYLVLDHPKMLIRPAAEAE